MAEPRRASATFGLLTSATQRFIEGTLRATSNTLIVSAPNLANRRFSATVLSHRTTSDSVAQPSGKSWHLPHALDPSRDSTLTSVHRLLKARDRIAESYKRIKGAFKELQDKYVTTKDTLNVIQRYSDMKRMVKQVVVLEKQYWVLIDLPKQETSETQTDYITRILNCLDQRLSDVTVPSITKVSGIANLFGGSTQLADRARDVNLIEQLKSKSTEELRKDSAVLQNDLYKLIKKYVALRGLAIQLRTSFDNSKYYPVVPRYSMLKRMIKDVLRAPAFMEVCHEMDDF